ncbi:hypothetical protein EV292_107233 [Sphingomonas sp. BK235]|nr:hypothetical protein EV292_107233 [Sphingomonas sp. BK235]
MRSEQGPSADKLMVYSTKRRWTGGASRLMSRCVNLLLLLSALLSALTGVGASARQAQPAQAVAQQARAVAIVSAARRVAVRPRQVLAALIASAAAPRVAVRALAPREPIFAGRRRV